MATIKTERLILRRAQASDLEAMHVIFSDPEAMRYWSVPPHTDLAQTADFLAAMRDVDPAVSADFIVELDGTPIGKAGFWRLPEVGFIMHQDYWGQGYGTEFLGALIEFGFQTKKLDKITADVDPRNTASMQLLTKLGFKETGRAKATILIGDQLCDSVYFALSPQS